MRKAFCMKLNLKIESIQSIKYTALPQKRPDCSGEYCFLLFVCFFHLSLDHIFLIKQRASSATTI